MNKGYAINVKGLVEFVLRSGNIEGGDGFASVERALEGARIHRELQKEFKKNEGYKAEVSVKYIHELNDATLVITGRADGVFIDLDNKLIIDEIKTISSTIDDNVDYDLIHLAQAKCYGYILGVVNNSSKVCVRLIYCNSEYSQRKIFGFDYDFEELAAFFHGLLNVYMRWLNFDSSRSSSLDNQIDEMKFPFEAYRPGQRELAVSVYKTIAARNRLFVQAATGIGKTISVMFPAIKAKKEGLVGKVFFLTARTVGSIAAEAAVKLISKQCDSLSSITLTAKERICICEGRCVPEKCPRALGHFDRVNGAIWDGITTKKHFTRIDIEALATKHNVCPFELSLDISLWTDVIIADYNYLFNPRSYLKRFFTDKGNYCFLVDEAHNLIDRRRDMFSSRLSKRAFMECSRLLKSKGKSIAKSISNINKHFIVLGKMSSPDGTFVSPALDKDLLILLAIFLDEAETFLATEAKDDLYDKILELFFECSFYIKISELFDEHYYFYIEKSSLDVRITLFCADPSLLISKSLDKGNSTILFSGTLQPLNYFFEMLGGSGNDKVFCAPSPFDSKNRCVIISGDISTKYKLRDQYYGKIAEYIQDIINIGKGNYMVYFSSYSYMEKVAELLPQALIDVSIFVQRPSMPQEEREAFLEAFIPNPTGIRVGLCILGGIYSEGIDLTGDRLSGVIIVGVGLPQVCLEREIIRKVFDAKTSNSGFETSYVYPGINKILQAAGRLIRTDSDRGFIILLDERYFTSQYKTLIPPDWQVKWCRNRCSTLIALNDFLEK